MSPVEGPIFEALINPHRSLTRRGVVIVVSALAALTAAVALRFCLLGAWPVAVFSVLEAPLVFLLLVINLRRARASELIMLDTYELKVIRTDPTGRREHVSLSSAWLRVELESGKGIPHVVLRSHGRGCEVGAFLHEPDKVSLFEGLRDALYRLRNPRFENPQLNDDRPLK